MAKISSKNRIAFASLILFSLIFLSFGYAANFNAIVTPTSINEDTEVLLNFTINNTDTTLNITQVNITLPTDFSFVDDTNGTSASNATFSNTTTTLNWTNTTTEGFIKNGSIQYFWFNVTATQPGTYNVTIDTLDTSTTVNSTNVTITVENTPYTGCVNLSDNSTFQNKISGNLSSGFEINDSISLCTGSYNLYSGPSFFLEIVSDNLVIDGNNSQFVGGGAVLYVESQDNVTIKNFNVIYSDYGIYLNSSSNVKILNNNIGSFTNGIYLFSSSDNTIQYNNISEGWGEVGIYLDSGSGNTIQYNNISKNQNGIYLFSSSNNTIGNNTASDNTYSGISLQSSSNNTILNNTVSFNNDGIYLESSSNNTIGNNTASDNYDSGIYLFSSSNNTIGNNT
ncbi:MAG: hypothetical protein PWQ28_750, partial [Candidatus Woesearchaeota archaeon]|nr:hypothetical protein [Candidatus Woesearchaeota archaeon]